ncbi:protein of unknown function (plasmid) [Cupriavidus neocaledonicus]|uniref:Uncharacterized protein n=1 Tax=Cupriavidus neocaledonicus TaxID=1040979 RepID=A0A375HR01_9BURK|nr:hypothetical protein CBM2605_B70023 [Cupriavidus neocaledonicus]SPD60631.1 protein of unknown function [Cupriavidus neocaledonicus]
MRTADRSVMGFGNFARDIQPEPARVVVFLIWATSQRVEYPVPRPRVNGRTAVDNLETDFRIETGYYSANRLVRRAVRYRIDGGEKGCQRRRRLRSLTISRPKSIGL